MQGEVGEVLAGDEVEQKSDRKAWDTVQKPEKSQVRQ